MLKGQYWETHLSTFVTVSPMPLIMQHYLIASPMFGLLVLLRTYQLGDSHGRGFQGVSGFLDWNLMHHHPCIHCDLHLSCTSCKHFPHPLL